jgi:TolA-binding protein
MVMVFGGPATAVAAEETLLYAPRPAGQVTAPPSPADGVLVKRLTIKRGDTLYKLSRTYNGKGTYYPQILLFNDIADPNLIYAGKMLLVPLSPRREAAAASPQPPSPAAPGTEQPALPKVQKPPSPKPAVKSRPAAPVQPAAATPSPASRTAEQVLYSKAITAYQHERYQQAMDGFSRFLARYPKSPLAPDAALYKAEALLKLSGE